MVIHNHGIAPCTLLVPPQLPAPQHEWLSFLLRASAQNALHDSVVQRALPLHLQPKPKNQIG